MESGSVTLVPQKVKWEKKILVELDGLGGISRWCYGGEKDYYAVYWYESENILYTALLQEGKILYEERCSEVISHSTWKEDYFSREECFLYELEGEIFEINKGSPAFLIYRTAASQICIRNLDTSEEFFMPSWAVRVELEWDYRNQGTVYVQLWDKEGQTQIQMLSGNVALSLGKYKDVTLRDIAPAGQVDWFTFSYKEEEQWKGGLWHNGKLVVINVSFIRSTEIENVFYLSENSVLGECLWNIENERRSELYQELQEAPCGLFIGQSKKDHDLFDQKNRAQILQYQDDQLIDITPRDFESWIALECPNLQGKIEFLFVKVGATQGEIYCYQEGMWQFVSLTSLCFEENLYIKIRASFGECDGNYMIVKENLEAYPDYGYYFRESDSFVEMSNTMPFVAEEKGDLVFLVDWYSKSLTIMNSAGEKQLSISGFSNYFRQGDKLCYAKKEERLQYYYFDLRSGEHKQILNKLYFTDREFDRNIVLIDGKECCLFLDEEICLEAPEDVQIEKLVSASLNEQRLVAQTRSNSDGKIQLLKLNWN